LQFAAIRLDFAIVTRARLLFETLFLVGNGAFIFVPVGRLATHRLLATALKAQPATSARSRKATGLALGLLAGRTTNPEQNGGQPPSMCPQV